MRVNVPDSVQKRNAKAGNGAYGSPPLCWAVSAAAAVLAVPPVGGAWPVYRSRPIGACLQRAACHLPRIPHYLLRAAFCASLLLLRCLVSLYLRSWWACGQDVWYLRGGLHLSALSSRPLPFSPRSFSEENALRT
jgi:hypothetical protein